MSKKIKILLIAGARPNFMKIAPLLHEMKKHPQFEAVLVHTGQHYDANMSALFLEQFDIPAPDINLEVGSVSHAVQTARIMERFEKVCIDEEPHAVFVVGDVNSTAACTLAAAKLHITTVHYEAGLRSRDKRMPEEINRLVTDAICDFFFTTSGDASENLLKEGHSSDRIFMCGNLMIDSLLKNLEKCRHMDMHFQTLSGRKIAFKEEVVPGEYGVMTFHRPVNVDKEENLRELVDIWLKVSEKIPLVFPVHPRTRNKIRTFGLEDRAFSSDRLLLIDSVGYLQFLNLMKQAKFVLTDSGGIQEETTYLNIPCLTVRPCTERPVTIWQGSNKLIEAREIIDEVALVLTGKGKSGRAPRYWDGHTAERIVKILPEIIRPDTKLMPKQKATT